LCFWPGFLCYFSTEINVFMAPLLIVLLVWAGRSWWPAGFSRYADSAEINSVVAYLPCKLDETGTWAVDRGAEIEELNGVMVSPTDGRWFNVRPSNTEPLLRLNVGDPTVAAMGLVREDALALIRGESPYAGDGVRQR
jgi:phosphomannomutase